MIKKIKRIFLAHLMASGMFLAFTTSADTINTVHGMVERFVMDNIRLEEGDSLQVIVNQLNPDAGLPACNGQRAITFAQKNDPLASNAVFIECLSHPETKIVVPITLHVYTKVITTKRALAAGEAVTEDALAVALQDKTYLYDGYFKKDSEVLDMVAARNIAPGHVLTTKNLKPVTLVKRNQAVTLALRKGAIKVDMVGVARSDGYLNQAIKVMNPSSKKVVTAMVTGKNRVEINED